jgi:ParB/RepB/Spo0J family partition protein
MPKLQNGNSTRKISLSQIEESGNVRKDYRGIEELAQSIKTSGLLQPVAVKSLGRDEDGVERYELIAGHRRARAFRHLFDAGDPGFSMIDTVVVAGDKLTLQLVENLQRSDLTARERESGICQMAKNGKVSQREIAGWLGKTETYVSRNMRAFHIRETADKEGIDTSHISTGALCEIATAAGDGLPELLRRIAEEGGSVQAARKIGREYRTGPEPAEPADAAPERGAESEAGIEPESDEKTRKPLEAAEALEYEPDDIARTAPGNPRPRREGGSRLHPSERMPVEFDPPHRNVHINDVIVIITQYIDMAENRFAPSEARIRQDAAWDILALPRERLQ